MEYWPNFFIVGAGKAGTTSLYEYLVQHPKIYMSKEKEPHFFTNISEITDITSLPNEEKKKYLDLFAEVKDEIAIGEASTSYLNNPRAPTFIHNVLPNARIIIILRDPVERTFSHYFYNVRTGKEKLPFGIVIRRDLDQQKKGIINYDDVLFNSYYSEPVKRYLNVFGEKQVKIVIFEEFIHDVKGTVKEVLRFLNVPDMHNFSEESHNVMRLPRGKFAQSIMTNNLVKKVASVLIPTSSRSTFAEKFLVKDVETKPQMLKEDRIFLEEHFREDVLKLQKILGRSVPWYVSK